MNKKILKFTISIFLIFSVLFSFMTVSAEENPDGTITIDTITALNGDSVIIGFDISNNPGFKAMTISVTYDSEALVYEDYTTDILPGPVFAAHPDKNIIRVVGCNQTRWEATRNGELFTIKFKIKEDADFGFYPISISYKRGDVCKFNLTKLMPTIVSGGINIEYNGTNCSHKKYGEWETVANPSCTKEGVKQRKCVKCPHIALGSIPVAGHDFAKEWVIDKPATTDKTGVMSRHCTRCEATTDILAIPLKELEKENIKNELDAVINPSDFTDELLKDQLPDVYKENGNTSVPKNDTTTSKPNDSSSEPDLEQDTEAIPDPNEDEAFEDPDRFDGALGKIIDFLPSVSKAKGVLFLTLILLIRILII